MPFNELGEPRSRLSQAIPAAIQPDISAQGQREKDLPSRPLEDTTSSDSYKPLGELHYNQGYSGQPLRVTNTPNMNKPSLSPRKGKNDNNANSQGRSKVRAGLISSTKMASPKKSKSSTNLAALLSKAKPKSKNLDQEVKNKENEPPKLSIDLVRPPIWAEFSNVQSIQGNRIALNDTRTSEPEARKLTRQEPSPSKTRTSHQQPMLGSTQGVKIPLKAPGDSQPEQKVKTFGFLRKRSNSKVDKNDATEMDGSGHESVSSSSRPVTAESLPGSNDTAAKGHSRVQSAIVALSSKTQEHIPISQAARPPHIDINKAFEEMLEARNIPPEVREKMRALDPQMKMGLLKQNHGSSPQTDNGSVPSTSSSRPGVVSRTNTSESTHSSKQEIAESTEKKPRPRSFTGFTLGRGGSSPKKQKQSKTSDHSRGKSADLPRSTSTTSLNSIASSSGFGLFGKTPKPAVPNDFIVYLRSNIKPQNVEIGKLQKLKQLLRNETVSWVNEFITDGGMIELVNLVYRIIDIEWREEHEDNLLHHTLTCLKALTTTSAALQQLLKLEQKLFPALLALLFSTGEERKGPSEFTTRGLIISLLFASITASPTSDRARALLSYLRDPSPKETHVSFVAEMHRPRPYKKWFNEINNVSKEVFWIFLHSLNVIQYPEEAQMGTPYNVKHFPSPRPPVPAAPYVGSVEWDATIYLATHLDLLNSIIASLDSVDERNQVRTELKDSGFEKLMGGTFRTCKEKFYGHVHAGLSTWAGAARDDGWDSKDVREGPPRVPSKRSKSASPKKGDNPPVLDMPKLEFLDANVLSPLMFSADHKPEFDAWS